MSEVRKCRAFSIVDLLIVITICVVLCGCAVAAFSAARTDVIDSRLQSDVDTINYAIEVFHAKGGSFGKLTDPNAILHALKNHEEKSSGLVPFLGAADQMIDPGLAAKMQTPDEADGDATRAVWNPRIHRFALSSEGRGVKEFHISRD